MPRARFGNLVLLARCGKPGKPVSAAMPGVIWQRAMLSAIVVLQASNAAGPFPFVSVLRTLAALVPAAVDGLVRDVALLQVGDAEGAGSIAEEAGCTLVEAEDFSAALVRGVALARSPWIFVVRAGTVPGRSFAHEAAMALEAAEPAKVSLILREDRGRWRPWRAFRSPVAGIIAPRERLAGARCDSFAALVRRAKPARELPTRVAVLF